MKVYNLANVKVTGESVVKYLNEFLLSESTNSDTSDVIDYARNNYELNLFPGKIDTTSNRSEIQNNPEHLEEATNNFFQLISSFEKMAEIDSTVRADIQTLFVGLIHIIEGNYRSRRTQSDEYTKILKSIFDRSIFLPFLMRNLDDAAPSSLPFYFIILRQTEFPLDVTYQVVNKIAPFNNKMISSVKIKRFAFDLCLHSLGVSKSVFFWLGENPVDYEIRLSNMAVLLAPELNSDDRTIRSLKKKISVQKAAGDFREERNAIIELLKFKLKKKLTLGDIRLLVNEYLSDAWAILTAISLIILSASQRKYFSLKKEQMIQSLINKNKWIKNLSYIFFMLSILTQTFFVSLISVFTEKEDKNLTQKIGIILLSFSIGLFVSSTENELNFFLQSI